MPQTSTQHTFCSPGFASRLRSSRNPEAPPHPKSQSCPARFHRPNFLVLRRLGEEGITYDENIKPIFREHCLKCHGDDEQKADLNLANFTATLKGGSGDKAVITGRASQSLLFTAITAEDDAERMPPKKAAIPAPQIELIRQWIQGGLRESSASKSLVAERDTSFTPTTDIKLDGPPPMPESLPTFTPPTLKRPLPVIAMAASPRAPLIAVAAHEHTRLLDATTQQQLVALGGSGKVVKIYGAADGKLRHKLTDWITSLAFSPDGKKLASSDRAGGIHLWDATGGGILLSLSEHKAAVRALAWRSDSKMLASGGEDGLLIWWDAKDGWPTVTNNNAHPPARPQGFYGKIPNGVLAPKANSSAQGATIKYACGTPAAAQ